MRSSSGRRNGALPPPVRFLASRTGSHIVMIGGRHVLRPDVATRQLKDGDELAVFPAIGGG